MRFFSRSYQVLNKYNISNLFLIILLLFLSPHYVTAKNKLTSSVLKPFNVIRTIPDKQAIQVKLSPGVYDSFKSQTETINIEFPLPYQENIILELKRFNIIAANAKFLSGGKGTFTINVIPNIVLYRGKILGEPLSHVYLAFTSGETGNGYVTLGNGENYILSEGSFDSKDNNSYLTIHKESALNELPDISQFCGVDVDDINQHLNLDFSKEITDTIAGLRVANIAIDGDQSFVELFDNESDAQSYVIQLIGAVSDIYIRDVNIKLMLSFVRLWPTGNEPFSADDLYGFRDWWQNNEDTSGLNLVQLFSGRRDLSYGGVAFVSGTCGGDAYSIAGYLNGSFPTPIGVPNIGNWDIIVTAHEMGHNFGTYHTHDGFEPPIDDCGNGIPSHGTIMSYCHIYPGYTSNSDLRFHSLVQLVIESWVSFEDCLWYDCNNNGLDDYYDINLGSSSDANSNGIPDECEDCNGNGILDEIDILAGEPDIDANGVPDVCEPDCNGNTFPDSLDLALSISTDLNGNNIPDECEPDCNNNAIPDFAEIASGDKDDFDRNNIPDECQDCNNNGITDWIDLEHQFNLFVADLSNNYIREYHNVSGVPIQNLAEGFISQPYDVIVGSDRMLYIASFVDNRIVKINPQTGSSSTFVNAGSGGLNGPTSLVFSSDGNLLVTSRITSSILQYNGITGDFISEFVSSGSGGLSEPLGIIYGPNGNLFVTSSNNNMVLEYSGNDGSLVGTFISSGSGGLSFPAGLVYKPDGNLLVSSYNTDQVLEYNGSDGSFIGVFNDDYIPYSPWGIKIGPNNNIFVAKSSGSIRILEYTPGGRYYRSFIRGDDSLISPTGFAFLSASANDCNGNNILDECDIISDTLDSNKNGIPDECESCCLGIRGNIDGDIADEINIADLVYFVDYSFNSPQGPPPPCSDEADVDASGNINIGDIVYLVDYMFSIPPGPQPADCL